MNNCRKGFTIVELVIVIAIIAILAAVLIPTFGTVVNNARYSAAQLEAIHGAEIAMMLEGSDRSDDYWIVSNAYVFRYHTETGLINPVVNVPIDADCIKEDAKASFYSTSVDSFLTDYIGDGRTNEDISDNVAIFTENPFTDEAYSEYFGE